MGEKNKLTVTHWFFQNDRQTNWLDPKSKGELGVTGQGGKEIYGNRPKGKSQTHSTDCSQLKENITGAANGSWWPVTVSAHSRICGESLISAVSKCGHWIGHLLACNSTITLVYLPVWKSGDKHVTWRWYDTFCRNAKMVCGLYKVDGISGLTANNLTWHIGWKCINVK